MKGKVSIIVPVYNAEKYLKACIKSLLSQTYCNIELVLVNDGSKDSSLKILQDFAKKDSRIVVINKENEGSSITRMRGLEKASGDFVLFVDSDDRLARNTVELALEKMVQEKADVVCFGMCRYCGVLRKNYIFDFNSMSQDEFMSEKYIGFFGQSSFPVQICGKLYKRELFENIKFDSIFMGDDLCVNIQLLPKAGKIANVKKPLYFYRFASGGTSRFNPNFLTDYQVIKNYQNKYIEEYSLNSRFTKLIHIESLNVFRTYVISYLMSTGCDAAQVAEFVSDSYYNTEFIQDAVKWFEANDFEQMFKDDSTYSLRTDKFVKFNADEYCSYIKEEISAMESSVTYKLKRIIKRFI